MRTRNRRDAPASDINESQQPAKKRPAKNNRNRTRSSKYIENPPEEPPYDDDGSQQPEKEQAENYQNETSPSKDEGNPRLTTVGWYGNCASTVTEGEVSEERTVVSTLTGRSKASSSTISSSKVDHMDSVKTVLNDAIPKKWIAKHKFSNRPLAAAILKPYLKGTDPSKPGICIYIPPELNAEEFVDLAFRKIITPQFNEWRHRVQASMKKMYFRKWPGNGQFVINSRGVQL